MSTAPRSEPVSAVARGGRLLAGCALLIGCFLAGEALKAALGLVLPGNVLGLFLLLVLLGTRVVRLEWVEPAARWVLVLLPLLFVPIYVLAAEDKIFWRQWGLIIGSALVATVVALWIFIGRLAQKLLNG